MASKRMFSESVVETDSFLELPPTAQCLYFHLGMYGDDEGFVSSPRKITALCGCGTEDLERLIGCGLIYRFENGICYLPHWKINNYIRSDRRTPTIYKKEQAMLPELFPDLAEAVSTKCLPDDNQMSTSCQATDRQMSPQNRIDKNRTDKRRTDKGKRNRSSAIPTRSQYGEYQNVLLSGEDLKKLQAEYPADWKERIERLSGYMASTGKKYKNHLATIRTWARRDGDKDDPAQMAVKTSGCPVYDLAALEYDQDGRPIMKGGS